MEPIINWRELERIMMGGGPPPPKQNHGSDGKQPEGRPHNGYGGWDHQAEFYNQMAKMEAYYTLNQINCFDTAPADTVLDIGCGPGRITVPMAKRAKKVTSIDSSPAMLEFCKANAREAGLTNVTTKLLDWNEAVLGDNLEQHDIVIASRSVGMEDILKLSSFAKKYVVTIIWSNGAPSIPTISGYLFEDTQDNIGDFPPPSPMRKTDRRFGDNIRYNIVYDLGFNPNLNIVTDGFTANYSCREEAYKDLRRLRPSMLENKTPIFRKNTDRFLTDNPDGSVTYRCETKTAVMWWSPERDI